MPEEPFDRSFLGYLRVLRSGPGFAVRVWAFAVFALALGFERGFRFLGVVVGSGLVLVVVAIYPIYRRRGPDGFHPRR